MKNKINILAALLIAFVPTVKASTLMQYDMGIMTSGGVAIGTGSLFFISSGTDNIFDSGTFAVGATGLVKSSDTLLFATSIADGISSGNWEELLVAPTAAGQKITALFISGLTSSAVSYSTGGFIDGKTIGLSGGTAFAFGTYRNDAAETFGGGAGDAIPWVLPATTVGTASMSGYSNTGSYTGGDIAASLVTTSSFNLIPEPSSASLLALGMAGLVALRARRKS